MTWKDAEREERIASGTLEPTAEEALARDWEVKDRLAEMAADLGVTGEWTRFSPADCGVIEAALDLTLEVGPWPREEAEVIEGLRAKAAAGSRR